MSSVSSRWCPRPPPLPGGVFSRCPVVSAFVRRSTVLSRTRTPPPPLGDDADTIKGHWTAAPQRHTPVRQGEAREQYSAACLPRCHTFDWQCGSWCARSRLDADSQRSVWTRQTRQEDGGDTDETGTGRNQILDHRTHVLPWPLVLLLFSWRPRLCLLCRLETLGSPLLSCSRCLIPTDTRRRAPSTRHGRCHPHAPADSRTRIPIRCSPLLKAAARPSRKRPPSPPAPRPLRSRRHGSAREDQGHRAGDGAHSEEQGDRVPSVSSSRAPASDEKGRERDWDGIASVTSPLAHVHPAGVHCRVYRCRPSVVS